MKAIVLVMVSVLTLSSCVTKKKFTDLGKKHDKLTASNKDYISKNEALLKDKNALQTKLAALETEQVDLKNQIADLKNQLAAQKAKYSKLQSSYNDLQSNSSSAIQAKIKENQRLLSSLEDKENKLLKEQQELQRLQNALNARSQRIADLERLIADKENAMQQLKAAISDALKGFEGKGLTVEQRNGKVYVSMENKLLFAPGSWNVGSQGKQAVADLATVLVENPSIEVLIEGHTDDDPYKKGGVIQDNWDLSVKRATAIVRILQQNKVAPQQLTAAGKSEYIPVADNETTVGKSKNRRIEIVLSPNLDEITKLLN